MIKIKHFIENGVATNSDISHFRGAWKARRLKSLKSLLYEKTDYFSQVEESRPVNTKTIKYGLYPGIDKVANVVLIMIFFDNFLTNKF